MNPLESFVHVPRIAYFSMEIALCSEIPTYAGGLGVLAGDTLRASADLELPLVGVTLVSRNGYFRQEIDAQHRQCEYSEPWDPERRMPLLGAKIAVPIEGRDVWVQAWLYELEGLTGYKVPVIILDTNVVDNSDADREITDSLYGGDEAYRMKQEVVLGIGGARMLHALGFEVHTFHINEGHSAFLALELLWRFERTKEEVGPGESIYDAGSVRELCLFTTHTPVDSAHDQFSYDLVARVLGNFVDITEIKQLAGTDRLNMTRLAMNLSSYVNGVAKSHAAVSNSMYPGHRIHAITNGIHGPTWTCPSFAKLYDAHLPQWRHEPEILVRADQIPDEEIWKAHKEAKQELIKRVNTLTGVQLDPDLPIIGFARRMTSYKRPHLLFSDIKRLSAIARKYPVQVVLAGKAHPQDGPGKKLIESIHRYLTDLEETVTSAYLPDYNMELALEMTAGADIWLNTPLRPLEASGTSGMKAAVNGVLNLGVLDGWWLEACIEGVTGWAIGSAVTGGTDETDAKSVYDTLEHTVLPLYYNDHAAWIWMMKSTISKIAYYFNSHRMMRRYATEAYIR
jgi:starch phosphorylase